MGTVLNCNVVYIYFWEPPGAILILAVCLTPETRVEEVLFIPELKDVMLRELQSTYHFACVVFEECVN